MTPFNIISNLKFDLFAFFGFWLLKIIFYLNKRQIIFQSNWDAAQLKGRPILICCWHGRLLFPVFHLHKEGCYALAGLHKDAEIIARIANKLGWKMLRGSSSRGGVRVFKELLKVLNNKGKVFLTPDGPKGPQYQLKEGIIKSAINSDAIVLPLSGQASSIWKIKNWDEFVIPKPFGNIVHIFGTLVDVRDYGSVDEFRLAIKNEMDKTQANVDAFFN